MQTEVVAEKSLQKIEQIAEAIKKLAENKELMLAFDRDGTLVPYANRPEEALLDPLIHHLLTNLADQEFIKVVIVSARSCALLSGDFGDANITLAGNYGLEICYPGKEKEINNLALQTMSQMKSIRDYLSPLSRSEMNAIVEDHGLSVCLHWHTVPIDARKEMHEQVQNVASKFSQVQLKIQPTSYEFFPNLEWNKGMALNQIDSALPCKKKRAFVFTGDTAADEPGFSWVNDRQGLSIRVGSGGGNTVSTYQLADTNETRSLLELLVQRLC